MERHAGLSQGSRSRSIPMLRHTVQDGVNDQGSNAVGSGIHPTMLPWLSALYFELDQSVLLYCIKEQYFRKST